MSATPKTRASSTTARPSFLLRGKASRWIAAIVLVAVILIFFSVANDDWFTIVNYTLIAAIATLGLNVISGYTGQISLGIAFFMAIGAYTAAYLGGDIPSSPGDPLGLGLPFIIWLPAAGIVAALFGALIGPTALRLKGFYLGIVSLSLIFIGQYIFQNAGGITGGPQGRSFPVPAIGERDLQPAEFLLRAGIDIRPAIFLVDPACVSAGGCFCVQRDAFASRARIPGRAR